MNAPLDSEHKAVYELLLIYLIQCAIKFLWNPCQFQANFINPPHMLIRAKIWLHNVINKFIFKFKPHYLKDLYSFTLFTLSPAINLSTNQLLSPGGNICNSCVDVHSLLLYSVQILTVVPLGVLLFIR